MMTFQIWCYTLEQKQIFDDPRMEREIEVVLANIEHDTETTIQTQFIYSNAIFLIMKCPSEKRAKQCIRSLKQQILTAYKHHKHQRLGTIWEQGYRLQQVQNSDELLAAITEAHEYEMNSTLYKS